MNRASWNPRVPALQPGSYTHYTSAREGNINISGVRVHFFLLLAVYQFPFVSSQWLL
jgi:hypothetical protein